jgi:hypothetical protein
MSEQDQGGQPQRIVITNDDLTSDPASPPPPSMDGAPAWHAAPVQSADPIQWAVAQPVAPSNPWVGAPPGAAPPASLPGQFAGEQLPGLGAGPSPLPVGYAQTTGAMTWNTFLNKLGSNAIISGLTAGAVGGFIGWVLSELIDSPNNTNPFTSRLNLDWEAALWVMIFAIALGFVLMGWEGFTSGSPQKMLREGGIGAAIGAGAGLVGGFVAQVVYGQIVNPFSNSGIEILIRGLGWGIFGALVGLGLGIRHGARSIVNGLLGGAAGGFVAGVVFQALGQSGSFGGGGRLRMIGLTVTGVGVGTGIGLVTRVRRDAWLLFSGGPMRGKEFILQGTQTRVGSDYRCDIVLVKDAAVAPFHAVFMRYPNGVVALSAQSFAPVAVNGTATTGAQLRSGDTVVIGSSVLTYEQRGVATM